MGVSDVVDVLFGGAVAVDDAYAVEAPIWAQDLETSGRLWRWIETVLYRASVEAGNLPERCDGRESLEEVLPESGGTSCRAPSGSPRHSRIAHHFPASDVPDGKHGMGQHHPSREIEGRSQMPGTDAVWAAQRLSPTVGGSLR